MLSSGCTPEPSPSCMGSNMGLSHWNFSSWISTALCLDFSALQGFCRLPLPIVPPEWVSGDGGYRPPIFMSFQGSTSSPRTLPGPQRWHAAPQKGERRCQTTANLSGPHWKDWKQVGGEASKTILWERLKLVETICASQQLLRQIFRCSNKDF